MRSETTRAYGVYLALAIALFLARSSDAAFMTNFAGRTWQVSDRYGAPGPGWFSNACVWVDGNGWLHLQIKKIGTNWCFAEVQTTNTLGYGEYRWYVGSRVDDLDTNVVAGLFTYEYLPSGENEVDIEFTKAFTDDPATNLHYTIQPYYEAGHQYQKAMSLTNADTTHRFIWNPGYIQWDSWYGHSASPPDTNRLGSWTYTSNDVPVHSNEHCYINLWMFLGELPVETASNKLELIIKDFSYVPATNTLLYDEFADDTMSNIWATFGETTGGRLTETNDTLRINPVNEDYTALGYRTTNLLSWASNGLQYVFSASLKTVEVTTASTNGQIDLYSLQTFFNALSTTIYDSYWCSNAVSLKGGYDSANDSLRLELYTKTGWPQNWGNLRFSGTITNISAYANTNGLDLQLVLESANYRVRAYYLTNAVPVSTNSGASAGAHDLGSALYSGYCAIGAQNELDGRGVLCWNRTRVFTEATDYLPPPPPVVTNPPNVVQVGTNTTTWSYPIHTRQKKSRCQVLYLANQIGRSGVLTQLEFYVSGVPNGGMSNYTVRVQHTALSQLSNSWVSNGWATVFRSNITIGSVGWYAIPFNQPFSYNNASNLLVDFSVSNNWYNRHPVGFARYSSVAVNQCLVDRDHNATEPTNWAGTYPDSFRELVSYVVNVRLAFQAEGIAANCDLDDEFEDTAMSNIWEKVGNWDNAEFQETDGVFRVKAGVNGWQTSAYVSTNRLGWSDTNGWHVFAAVLSTVRVDAAQGGEDIRTIIGICSERENPWYVTSSVSLHGRYDSEDDTLTTIFYTKTSLPSSDGTERFDGTISAASSYMGATNGIQMRILLGQQKYQVRFADARGQSVPLATNSGSTSGDHNLGAALYSCYWLVGVQNTETGRGSAFWDRTFVATSRAPASVISGAAQTSTNGQGLITITNSVYDPEGDPCALKVEASTNGGLSWLKPWITEATGTYDAAAAPAGDLQVIRVATTNGSGLTATNVLRVTWDTKHPSNEASLAGGAFTNLRVRIVPDDQSLPGAAVTSAVFTVDNAAPAAGGASVSVEGGAVFVVDAAMDAAWSGFTDASAIAGYYLSLTNNGGTASGNWTNGTAGRLVAMPDATNTVYVWGRDAFGNIGSTVSDSILVLSSGGDWDNDGLTNGAEGGHNCSPLDADSEDDGMPDGWEVQYGLNPTNSNDAGQQGDTDRYSNLDEYYWGTDPNSGSSFLSFDGDSIGGPTNCVLTWGGITGRLYSLYYAAGEYSNGMPWSPMAAFSNVAGAQGAMIYTDRNTSAEGRYYKLRVKLP